jgi:ATP-dependent Clp protease adaptor protein ClpS
LKVPAAAVTIGVAMAQPDRREQHELAEKERTKKKRPKLWKVLLHNDDYTTMEFVVEVLMELFHKDETEAAAIMLNVHLKGIGVAGVYTRDVAETKVAQVMAKAEERGMPLLVTAEPE